MELKQVSQKTINVKESCIIAAFSMLLFSQVFNGNKTAAGLAFVMVPVVIFAIVLFLCNRYYSWKKHYTLPVLMCIFAVISTLNSDVVSWTTQASSMIVLVLVYMVATAQIYKQETVRAIMGFYCGMVVLIACWILLSYILNINLVDGRASISFFGIVKDQNYLSAFMTPVFAFITYAAFFGTQKKLLNMVKLLVLFVAIYLTGSRAALIAMVASFMVILVKYAFYRGISVKKILMLAAVLIIVIVGVVWMQGTSLFDRMGDVEGYSSNIRLEIWGYAMEGFYRHPILGSGIQAGTYYSQLKLRWYTHSCFVDILVGQGIVGAVLYLGMFWGFLKANRGNRCFVSALMVAAFIPLFFVNGYEALNFWMPMMMCQVLSSTARQYGCENLIQ